MAQVGRERFLQGRGAEMYPDVDLYNKSVVRAIPIHVKPTPGGTFSVRASFSHEDEKHPRGNEKNPGRAAGQFAEGALSL